MHRVCPHCGAEVDAPEGVDETPCASCGRLVSLTLADDDAEAREDVSAEAATVSQPHVRLNCSQCRTEFLAPLAESKPVCPHCGSPPAAGRDVHTARTVVPEGGVAPVPASAPEDENAAVEWIADRLAGKYEILGFLGRGGMGVVYRATQVQPRRDVALKVMLGGAIATASNRRRFAREAQAVAMLKHPAIVPVFEYGEVGGQPYFTMEYVRGVNLRSYVRRHGLGRQQICRLMVRVCDAVHYAHQHGVIHRDLKPGNVMVDEFGRPRILDFGLARVSMPDGRAMSMLTASADLLGTPQYMSPEQAMGGTRGIDELSDVYALGVMFYELIVGVLPYPVEQARGLKALEILRSVQALSPSALHPTIQRDLETIVVKGVEKDRSLRYRSAEDLARDLENFLEGRPISARPTTVTYRLNRWAWRHRKVLVPAAGALAAVAVITFIYTGRLRGVDRHLITEQERAAGLEQAGLDKRLGYASGREAIREAIVEGDWEWALATAEHADRFWPGEEGTDELPELVREAAEEAVGARLNEYGRLLREQDYGAALDTATALGALGQGMPFEDLAAELVRAEPDFDERCWDDLRRGVEDQFRRADALAIVDAFVDALPRSPHVEDARALRAEVEAEGAGRYLERHRRALQRAMAAYDWPLAEDVIASARAQEGAGGAQWSGERAVMQRELGAVIRAESIRDVDQSVAPCDLGGMGKAVAFAPGGLFFVTCGLDQPLAQWNPADGEQVAALGDAVGRSAVAVSPAGSVVAAGGVDGAVALWSLVTGEKIAEWKARENRIASLQFTPDGGRLLAADVKGALLRDVATGAAVLPWGAQFASQTDEGGNTPKRPAALSPDGRLIAAVMGKGLTGLWRSDRGGLLRKLDTGTSPALLAFSPNGSLLATGHTEPGQRKVRLWEVQTGRKLGEQTVRVGREPVLTHQVWALAFSPDGRLLVTGGADATVAIWSIPDLEKLAELTGHAYGTTAAAFADDCRTLVTVGNDSVARIWRVRPPQQ